MPCKKICVWYNKFFSCVKQTYVVQKHSNISWPLSYFYGSYSQKLSMNKKTFKMCPYKKYLTIYNIPSKLFGVQTKVSSMKNTFNLCDNWSILTRFTVPTSVKTNRQTLNCRMAILTMVPPEKQKLSNEKKLWKLEHLFKSYSWINYSDKL